MKYHRWYLINNAIPIVQTIKKTIYVAKSIEVLLPFENYKIIGTIICVSAHYPNITSHGSIIRFFNPDIDLDKLIDSKIN